MTITKPTIQASLNKSRSDKFRFVMNIPTIFKHLESTSKREEELINLDSIQFSLYDATIPEINVPEHPLHIYGQNYNITSYDRPAYPPVVCSFEVDNEYKNYWILQKWLNLYNDKTSGLYASKDVFPDGKPKLLPETEYDYVTDIKIIGLDEYNNETTKFTFKYAFLTKLGQLSYNYRDDSQLKCHFSFVFNQMDINLI